MENSFFEYRDKTGVDSDSGSEIIDNSLDGNESFTFKKTPLVKNQTVFVAESEESTTDEESDEEPASSKNKPRKISIAAPEVVSSSDEDASRRGSIRRQSQLEVSFKKVVLNSSHDETDEVAEPDVSPEILPKRRPPLRPQPTTRPSTGSDSSIIRQTRKKNKRMVLVDSESENSIIMEYNKNKKQLCLKNTPLKVEDNKMLLRKKALSNSIMDQSVSYTDENSDSDESDYDGVTKNLPKTPSRIKNRELLNESDDSDHESDDDINNSDDKNDNLEKISTNTPCRINNDLLNDSDDSNHESDDNIHHNDDSNHESDEDTHQIDKKNDNLEKSTKKAPSKLKNKILSDSEDSDHETDFNHQYNKHHQDIIASNDDDGNDEEAENSEDNGPDEDQMVMSRATRMSIMGMVPRHVGESDESDFIQSEENTRSNSACSIQDLPDVTIARHAATTPEKHTPENDSSRISCSPFSSPLHDITNDRSHIDTADKKPNKTAKNDLKSPKNKNVIEEIVNKENQVDDDVTFVSSFIDPNASRRIDNDDVTFVSTIQRERVKRERMIDDDVTIVESKPEVIALSSDDEEPSPPASPEVSPSEVPRVRKDNKPKENTIRQYLAPPSQPGQVVYVKKHVRENELAKLNGLKEDLQNVRYLLENMDMETLPDGGARLIDRLTNLERDVRAQGDRVANMIVEPDMPTQDDMAKDGFGGKGGPSWEELQKGSQAVQPRMFGKQAMATHMAERNVILERLRDLHASLGSRPGDSALAPPPRAVRSQLMKHQLHALLWLRWRETQRPTGGILADDMGLGKTLTMIALVVGDKDGAIDEDDDDDEEGGKGISKLARGGTLVVCPASLMQQWAGEVSKHCTPHAASVTLHHGAARATHPHRLAAADLVLTTYNILQRDHEKNGVLMKILWRRIILDEAHIVRNSKSATSVAVSALKGRRRWCLTGTPVQNKDLDLFALLKFLRCTPFDELPMWKKWIDNKSQGGQDRLNTIMHCILLRRTKAQLQEKGELTCLPARSTHLIKVTLSKEETNVYQKVLVFSKTLFAQFLHQRAEKQGLDAPGNKAYDEMHRKMIALQGAKPVKSHEILVLLLRLRQVCCHCGLIAAMLDEDTADGAEDPAGRDLLDELNKMTLQDKKAEDVDDEAGPTEGTTADEAIRSVLSPHNPVFRLDHRSSKISAVLDCLHQNVFANAGHKAVVVSQWTSVLRLVQVELDKAGVRSVTLSGSVPVPARPPLIDKLNDPKSDVRVMLLSLCAGGVGLNLCGANHLLLLDPHWNPQLEEQAQDRVYRVGQARPVHIYRFMCVDTVEQSIRALQQAKLDLADSVLTGAKNTNQSKLSIEELKILFNMGNNSSQ